MVSRCSLTEPRFAYHLARLSHRLSYLSVNARNTWHAKHHASHVCTQSASTPIDRRERQMIDTGAKARVRFPATKSHDETRNYGG